MNDRAIGVFDSGLGGLTCVKELKKLMPNESIIYFGDTGRVPYGTRSRETIIKYVSQNIRFLKTFGVKLIAAACGTASTLALEEAKAAAGDIPVIGVVEGASEDAARATKNGRIGVIGTPATIGSGAYERKLKSLRPDIYIKSAACPLFVPVVENGRADKDDPIVKILVREYLSGIKDDGCDTLILGCTHYPLLRDAISEYLGGGVSLIDSGRSAALKVAQYVLENSLEAHKPGQSQFYVSDANVYNFSSLAGMFLGEDIGADVLKADIEKY
ncbi:MAG: glutamate racemase [Clostridia bacterium]|nr:glutamate racemase [Clostridia bacterium]